MANPLFDPPEHVQEAEETQAQLIAGIKADSDNYLRAGEAMIDFSRRMGKRLMKLKAKISIGARGGWEDFVRDTFHFSVRSAQRYIRSATNTAQGDTVSHLETQLVDHMRDVDFDQIESNTAKCCRPCRVGTPKPNCPECRKMNEPSQNSPLPKPAGMEPARRQAEPLTHDVPSSAPSGPESPPAARQAAIREPGDEPPNQWLDPWRRVQKTALKKLDELTRFLSVPKPVVAAIRERLTGVSEWWTKAAASDPLPIKAPRSGICKYCKASITWATTDKRKNVALDESANGNWDIVDNVACLADSGPYRLHFLRCSNRPRKGTSEGTSDELLPE